MKNLHVPLQDELHAALMAHARQSGESATAIAREAIENALWKRQLDAIRTELAAYAVAVAGTVDDLDPELEAAGLEVWMADE